MTESEQDRTLPRPRVTVHGITMDDGFPYEREATNADLLHMGLDPLLYGPMYAEHRTDRG